MTKEKVYIIKIGGNVIDNADTLDSVLGAFSNISGKKILVHGGGKLATKLAEQLNIKQTLVDGRRITDAETLKIITMVYAGYINKNIVAVLQSNGCNAIGITGADGDAIKAHKRIHPTIDYGFVGDVDGINKEFFKKLLNDEVAIIVAPITHDNKGQLLNTNADTIAQELAKGLSADYEVDLIYSFEKKGVLKNADDDNTLINNIDRELYAQLKNDGVIFAGMIPKLDNAFAAIENGVSKVIIGKAEDIQQLIKGETGTTIH